MTPALIAELRKLSHEGAVMTVAEDFSTWTALLDRIEKLERALQLNLHEPTQISIEEMDGPCLVEKWLDEWVCNHCGVHGDAPDKIEHDDECGYAVARAALATDEEPK